MLRASREKVVHNAEKLISRGKIESGIKEYRKLLSENPNDISTLNRVGDLYARISRNSEAIELFKRIAEQYAEDGFLVKAIAIYKKIIKLDPTLLEIYEQLADLYHRQGLVNEARTQYQVLADYYQKHDKPASALKVHERMVELEPDNPTHHAKLAELYQKDGMISAALGEYRAIAELMLEHGRGEEAAQVYERGLAVTSEDIGFITDGVLKLKESGHVAAAARFLSLAVERNPKAEQVARVAGLGAADDGAKAAAEAPAPAAEEATGHDASTASVIEGEGEEQTASTLGHGTAAGLDSAEVVELEPPGEPVEAAESAEPAGMGGAGQVDLTEPEAAPDLGELELEGFDLEEPESLVQPPADMLEDRERRGAAWEEGGTGTWTGTRSEPAPEPAAPAAEEASPPEGATGTFEFELDLDADDEGLLDLTPPPQTAETYQSVEPDEVEEPVEMVDLAQPEPSRVDLDHDLLERTAAEVHADESGGPDELFTEAEVLVRYGIEEKALDRLAELLQRYPRHLEGYRLMVTLHLEAGRHGRAAAVASRMVEVAGEVGDDEIWPEVWERLGEEGYQLSGLTVVPPPGFEVEVEAEEPAAEGFPEAEPDVLVEAEPDVLAEAEAPESSGEVVFELTDDEPEPQAIEVDLAEDRFELPDVEPPSEVAPETAAEAEAEAAERAPASRKRAAEDVDAALAELSAEFVGSRPKRKKPAPPPPAEEVAEAPEAAPEPAEEPLLEPATEVAQEAVQEAIEEPTEVAAEDFGVDPLRALGDSLREEIDLGAVEGSDARIPAEPPPAPTPMTTPKEPPEPAPAAADSGIGWLDEVSAPASDGALFAAEDDFFDLGAELEQELTADGALHAGEDLLVSSTEQSLEDIVEGFKKGVSENLSSEDYDTHFNLGIAYREMGLLDEAIGEFQLAAKSPSFLVECASMLGLCFQEKGMPELAVKWYQRGLEAEGIPEEDHLGLLYDLGNAQAAAGDSEAAYGTFVDLYGINTNYRDVVARLAELEPGRAG